MAQNPAPKTASTLAVSTSAALGGASLPTAGMKLAAATPAVVTSVLYSPDGAALYFNGSPLATGSSVSGTTGRLSKFTAPTTLGDSLLAESGSTVSMTGTFNATSLGGTLTTAAQTAITSVGTLTGGATGAGFTIALSTSTVTGTIPSANVSGSYTGITGVGTLTAGATGAGFTVALTTSTVTGTLTVTNGGTGATSFTADRILFGAGVSALTNSGNLTFTGGNLLTVTGTVNATSSYQLNGVGNSASSVASSLVSRDGNADFAGRNITATLFIGSGASLTNLPAGSLTGQVALANGGTAANLTAVNGGIFYSTATAGAISAAGSSGQLLRSAGAAAPTWTTATFPATAGTSGNALVSNGTNWASTAIPNSIAGTANQVIASGATGAITLSLPQSIATSSSVQFAAIGIGGAVNNGILYRMAGSTTLGAAFAAATWEMNSTATANGSAFQLQIGGALISAATGTHSVLAGIQNAVGFTDSGATITSAVGTDITTFSTFANMTNAYGLRVAAPGAGAGTVYIAQFGGSTGVNFYRSGGVAIGQNLDAGLAGLRVGNSIEVESIDGFSYISANSAALGTGAVNGPSVGIGNNTSGNGAAGYLNLNNKDDTSYYLWVDATGDLRIGTAPPTENGSVSDTSGTVVGTQS